jgi:hypothetical protein
VAETPIIFFAVEQMLNFCQKKRKLITEFLSEGTAIKILRIYSMKREKTRRQVLKR